MSENEMLEEIKSLSPSEEAILTMLVRYQNLKAELEKEKEKNKLLEDNYSSAHEDINWFCENYISKDKLKEIIYGDYEDLEIILMIKRLIDKEE